MPWIIITKMLPVQNRPPKLSIHHVTPWGMTALAEAQLKRMQTDEYNDAWLERASDGSLIPYDGLAFGFEHDETRAMRLHFYGEDIKIFPDEFNILTSERMYLYVFGDDKGQGSHYLVPGTESDAALLRAAMDTDLQTLFDAALLDGCTPEMAQAVAMGIQVEDSSIEFPPIGWYRCHVEYGLYICDEEELMLVEEISDAS